VASRLRVALDEEFAPLDAPLREGCEVALIPPVAGGLDAGEKPGEKNR